MTGAVGAALGIVALAVGCAPPSGTPLHRPPRGPAAGPLHVDPANPRYFADAAGRLVYLEGSHTWSNLQDYGFSSPPTPFAYRAYLDSLVAYDHNFMRLWRWEQAAWQTETTRDWWFSPQPYLRTGPGTALDGQPRFDLTRFNPEYFDRLRRRVAEAGRRGIYVAVMLFNGWSIERKDRGLGDPWRGHPFNRTNNINGIDGDPDGQGNGLATHTLRITRVLALQEHYVARVIETVGDLDNVLYEISNESRPGSAAWQYHMIRFIHDREAHRAKRHPVGMTVEYPGGDNQALVDSPADWISPRGMAWDPPATDGRKVIVWDTDHVGGLKTNPDAAWRAFTRGANPLLMDPFDSTARDMDIHLGPEYRPDEPLLVTARRTLGQTLALATQMHLERMVPRPDLATTGYCLADTARGRGEYLAYLPEGGRVTLDLGGARDVLAVRWFSPSRGETYDAGTVRGGNRSTLRAPFRGPAVLFLFAAAPDPPEPSP